MTEPARYLFDTSAVIDVSRRGKPLRTWIRTIIERDGEVGVCSVLVTEFFSRLLAQERRGALASAV